MCIQKQFHTENLISTYSSTISGIKYLIYFVSNIDVFGASSNNVFFKYIHIYTDNKYELIHLSVMSKFIDFTW